MSILKQVSSKIKKATSLKKPLSNKSISSPKRKEEMSSASSMMRKSKRDVKPSLKLIENLEVVSTPTRRNVPTTSVSKSASKDKFQNKKQIQKSEEKKHPRS